METYHRRRSETRLPTPRAYFLLQRVASNTAGNPWCNVGIILGLHRGYAGVIGVYIGVYVGCILGLYWVVENEMETTFLGLRVLAATPCWGLP